MRGTAGAAVTRAKARRGSAHTRQGEERADPLAFKGHGCDAIVGAAELGMAAQRIYMPVRTAGSGQVPSEASAKAARAAGAPNVDIVAGGQADPAAGDKHLARGMQVQA